MTASQVKALQVGETVTVRKEGHEPVICMVAFRGRPDNKFLTYRVKGEIKMFDIRDYPDISYERRWEDAESIMATAEAKAEGQ